MPDGSLKIKISIVAQERYKKLNLALCILKSASLDSVNSYFGCLANGMSAYGLTACQ